MPDHPSSASFRGFLKPTSPSSTPSQPIICRGNVYCGKDFWTRSAVWYALQQQKLETQKGRKWQKKQVAENAVTNTAAGKTKKAKTPRRVPTVAPTRIQPSRAAKAKNIKRKADEVDRAEELAAPAVSKRPRPEQLPSLSSDEDYSLDEAFAGVSVQAFREKMDTLLEGKRAALARSCFWSTAMAKPPVPPSSAPCANHWCPIVAAPLACNDKTYCSHGMSFTSSAATTSTCAAAPMMTTPPCTPSPRSSVSSMSLDSSVPTASRTSTIRYHQAKPFAEQQHIQARTMEFAGLRFAVDMCNGMLRVYMV